MSVVPYAVVATCAFASFWDLRTGRIPNALTLATALAATGFHAWMGGWGGTLTALGGLACGVALFFPFFWLRGMGAGDVKLLAALGAWLGPAGVLWTAFYCAIAGGLLALWVSARRGYLGTLFRNVRFMLTHWYATGLGPIEGITLEEGTGPRLPYAVPISIGAMVTLWLK